MSQRWVIFDLDGTLSDCDWRRGHVDGTLGKPDWNAFHQASVMDAPREGIVTIAKALDVLLLPIIIMTGRNERYRVQTVAWLKAAGVHHDQLLMRGDTDFRPDTELKAEMLSRMYQRYKGDPFLVFDDRAAVVKMWRAKGLTTLQVAEGDF